jgi:hypothetical protein
MRFANVAELREFGELTFKIGSFFRSNLCQRFLFRHSKMRGTGNPAPVLGRSASVSFRATDLRLAAGVVLAAAVTACGGGGSGPSPQTTAPPPIVVTNTFPPNVAAPSGGGTAWDITQVTTTLSSVNPGASGNLYDTLQIDMTFQQDISNALPAPGTSLSQGNQLGVATFFDPDGNSTTGNLQGCATAGTTPFNYYSDEGKGLGRLVDGNYALDDIYGPAYTTGNTGGTPGLEAVTNVAGNVLTQTYKLSAVGVTGLTVSTLKIQFLVFNGLGAPVTECVPLNGSELAVTSP